MKQYYPYDALFYVTSALISYSDEINRQKLMFASELLYNFITKQEKSNNINIVCVDKLLFNYSRNFILETISNRFLNNTVPKVKDKKKFNSILKKTYGHDDLEKIKTNIKKKIFTTSEDASKTLVNAKLNEKQIEELLGILSAIAKSNGSISSTEYKFIDATGIYLNKNINESILNKYINVIKYFSDPILHSEETYKMRQILYDWDYAMDISTDKLIKMELNENSVKKFLNSKLYFLSELIFKNSSKNFDEYVKNYFYYGYGDN